MIYTKGGDRMSREIVNSVLLLWGSLFCAVSSLYF